MTVFMLMMWAIMCYLIGRVAYNEGRKSKWEEMCREYICIHKSVCIKTCEKEHKTIDKCRKNKYNNKAYKKKKHIENVTQ